MTKKEILSIERTINVVHDNLSYASVWCGSNAISHYKSQLCGIEILLNSMGYKITHEIEGVFSSPFKVIKTKEGEKYNKVFF